jgi:Big-like domain-containing protein
MRTLPLLTLVLATAAAGMGCQSGASLEPPADPESRLTVLPNITSVDGGKTLRLTARVRQADGSITSPADIAWLSEDGAIASVDAGGTVRGLRAGRVQIVATWHDSRGFSLVTVLEPVGQKPDGKQPKPQCTEKGVAGAAAEIPTGVTCP